jgi:hypothetical protein
MGHTSGTFSPLLFTAWLEKRRETQSLSEIGASLGVSKVAVSLWLSGKRKPPQMAMILASHLSGPVDLRPGLPGDK